MSQCILVFRGFGRAPSLCHVVVAHNDRGDKAVLVGELDDNPGTTVTNAIEQVAENIRHDLLNGDYNFELYEYVPRGLPELKPTFYRIVWKGRSGQYSMPEWQVVEPDSDHWLRSLRHLVMENGYTSQALIVERKLEVIDSREPENLPAAI
jgi:hypothetical protein